MSKSLLDLYTDYLISSFGQTTGMALSRLLGGEISHDQVTRFLASPAKTGADLWRVVKLLVRQIENQDGVLILDGSIKEKPSTDENELICRHWDQVKERSLIGLPVAFDLVTKTEFYLAPKTGRQTRRSGISKNERGRMLLRVCLHNQLQFSYVLNDSWYASADNMKFINRALKKEFAMLLKANRKDALSPEDKQRGRYQAASVLDLPAGKTSQIWLEEVAFPLLLAKQVFTNEDGSRGTLYPVSSDLTLDYDRMTKLYQKRSGIEVYHKSLKQNAGLEKPRPELRSRGIIIYLPAFAPTSSSRAHRSTLG